MINVNLFNYLLFKYYLIIMFPKINNNISLNPSINKLSKTNSADISSIDLNHLINIVQINGLQQKKHNIQYFAQLIHIKTSGIFSQFSAQIAAVAKFYKLQSQQTLYRPGEIANSYYIILHGKIGRLQDQQLFMYNTGQGVGDQQFHLQLRYRNSYAFECSANKSLVCQITYQSYRNIFKKKIQNIKKFEHELKQKCSFFYNVSPINLKLILKDSEILLLKKGQILYDRYQDVRGIYIQLDGKLKQTFYIKSKVKGKSPQQIRGKAQDFQHYIEIYQQLRTQQKCKEKVLFHQVCYQVIGQSQINEHKLRRQTKIQALKPTNLLYISFQVLNRYIFGNILYNKHVYSTPPKDLIIQKNSIKKINMKRRKTIQHQQSQRKCSLRTKTLQNEENMKFNNFKTLNF